MISKDGSGTSFGGCGRNVVVGNGGEGGSAERAEMRLKLVTIVVTVLVERLRAARVGFSLKISAIKAKTVGV